MLNINPIDAFFWTFRRNPQDVVNLYDALSSLMQITTDGNMLNFGYWKDITSPHLAQVELCNIVGKLAELEGSQNLLDIGSGFSEPSINWNAKFPHLNVICFNLNSKQLFFAKELRRETRNSEPSQIELINSTAMNIPIANNSVDRIIALESAQHFRPLPSFISESRRVLKKDGLLVMAIPVITKELYSEIAKLGILAFTWSSEHYKLDYVKNMIAGGGFNIVHSELVGPHVYEPMVEYYIRHRNELKDKILEKYPSLIEKILFRSLLKMKQTSEKRIIDYALLKCVAE